MDLISELLFIPMYVIVMFAFPILPNRRGRVDPAILKLIVLDIIGLILLSQKTDAAYTKVKSIP